MHDPKGPGTPFHLLFSDEPTSDTALPDSFRLIYPGDWQLHSRTDRPFVFTNFAQSRDGRVSYNEPGISTGGDVTRFNAHDRWLMGLARSRADAVMMGDVTVKVEGDHLWSAEFICPSDAQAFTNLRRTEKRRPLPFLVVLSYDGNIGYDQAAFQDPHQHIILATTHKGAQVAQDVHCTARMDVLDLGESTVDLHRLMQVLYHDYRVQHLLCEGGPHVMGGMLNAGLVDEEFVTICPTFVGRDPNHFRPSYTEGVAWLPGNAPYSQPVTLHRAGDFLYMRTRCQYQTV